MRTTILLSGEESGGAVSIAELAVPPRWEGPPLHRHASDEAVYVLEGELAFQLGDELRPGTPGGRHRTAPAPSRLDEAFYLLDGELTLQLGEERFVRRAGELAFAPRGAHHTFGTSAPPKRAR